MRRNVELNGLGDEQGGEEKDGSNGVVKSSKVRVHEGDAWYAV
jgi:hypothetical protein